MTHEEIFKIAVASDLAYARSDGRVWIDAGFADGPELLSFVEMIIDRTHTNNKAVWYREGYEAGLHDAQNKLRRQE